MKNGRNLQPSLIRCKIYYRFRVTNRDLFRCVFPVLTRSLCCLCLLSILWSRILISLAFSLTLRNGGGGGREESQQSFMCEGSSRSSKPLPFCIALFTVRVTLSCTCHRKWYPFPALPSRIVHYTIIKWITQEVVSDIKYNRNNAQNWRFYNRQVFYCILGLRFLAGGGAGGLLLGWYIFSFIFMAGNGSFSEFNGTLGQLTRLDKVESEKIRQKKYIVKFKMKLGVLLLTSSQTCKTAARYKYFKNQGPISLLYARSRASLGKERFIAKWLFDWAEL